MSQAELRRIIRNPRSTPQQLGDALRRYLLARRAPHKLLGDGSLLVIDQRGRMALMTRAAYSEAVYRKRKRKKQGELLVYDSIAAGTIESQKHAPELDRTHAEFVGFIDDFAKRHGEDGYHAEF